MPLAFLTSSCLAHIQDMLLPNVVLYLSLYLIFNWQIFFACRLLAKRTDFVLSSPKWILSLLSTNQSQRFSKSSLSHFSICTMSLCWYKIHELSAYKSRVDGMACGILLTWIRNNRGPKIDSCGTPEEIFPKSESLFSVFTRNNLSEKYDLNLFIVLSENLIALSFWTKSHDL